MGCSMNTVFAARWSSVACLLAWCGSARHGDFRLAQSTHIIFIGVDVARFVLSYFGSSAFSARKPHTFVALSPVSPWSISASVFPQNPHTNSYTYTFNFKFWQIQSKISIPSATRQLRLVNRPLVHSFKKEMFELPVRINC